VLNEKNVRRQPIEVDATFEPALPDGTPSGIEITPFAAPGKSAWYLEGSAHPAGDDGAPAIRWGCGLATGRAASIFIFSPPAPASPTISVPACRRPLIFFDGTVWRDDE